jgi:hypothetical protein
MTVISLVLIWLGLFVIGWAISERYLKGEK